MRDKVIPVLVCALAIGFGLRFADTPARAQDAAGGTEPQAALPGIGVLEPDRIWNFHFEGAKRRGDFLELAALDADEHRGQVLVMTHLAMSLPHSTRLQVVEFHREGDDDGKRKTPWKKRVRRSEAFSLGWMDSTSKDILAGQSSLVGLKFEPGTRPTLEVTQGGGDIAIYAEGYWADVRGGRSPATRAPVSGGK